MKKKWLTAIVSVLFSASVALGITACFGGGDDGDDSSAPSGSIAFQTLSVDGTNVEGVFSNATTQFSFLDEVVVTGDVEYIVSWDEQGTNRILDKILTLEEGENRVYVIEKLDGYTTNRYLVVLYRRPMLTVSFDTDDGSMIQPQQVEEGSCAVLPTEASSKLGYDFVGWDFDFATPITEATEITALWEVKEEMKNFLFTSTATTCNIEDIIDETVTEIIIPDCVTSISYEAFNYCVSATRLVVGENVTSISYNAFVNCHRLIEVFNKSNLAITALDGNFGKAGYYAKNVYTPTEGESKLTTDANGCILYTDEEGTIFVGYTGESAEVVIPQTVTEIYKYAFVDCEHVTDVTIGVGVTSFGEQAFNDCSALENVYYTGTVADWCGAVFATNSSNPLSKTESFFIDGSEVTELIIPGTVSKINDRAFCGSDFLTKIVISKGVTEVGQDVFEDCSSVREMSVPFVGASTTSTGRVNTHFGYFFGSPSSAYHATYVPSALTKVTIESTYLSSEAFFDCRNIQEIVIGDSVTDMGSSTFSSCSSLLKVTIGSGLTTLPSYAFSSCSSLVNVSIPVNILIIAKSAFDNCSGLGDVYYEGTLDEWCEISFKDRYANPLWNAESLYVGGRLVDHLVLPDTTTTISEYAFCGYKKLESVVVPNSVTSIGRWAFYACSNIREMTLPFIGGSATTTENDYLGYIFGADTSNQNGTFVPLGLSKVTVTGQSIGTEGLYNCKGLKTLVLAESVTSIGSAALHECTGLASVFYEGTKELWEQIKVNGLNAPLEDATIFYYVENEADVPTDDGDYWHYGEDGEIIIWTQTET